MEGTYPLPEAQRDRFMARIQMGYPTPNSELDMLDSHGSSDPLAELQPVTDGATIRGLIEAVKRVYVSAAVKHYIVQVVNATRNSRDLRLGASPRATLQLLRASRAFRRADGPRLCHTRRCRSPWRISARPPGAAIHRCPAGPAYGQRRHRPGHLVCAHS